MGSLEQELKPLSASISNNDDEIPVGNPNTAEPESPTKSLTSAESGKTSEEFLPIPTDGGYGWVIVIASFFMNGLVDGMCGSFGVIMPAFVEYFDESRAKTALAGSLMVGFFLISGPVVGLLVNLYGCRKIAMMGGVIAATSIALSRLSPTVDVLILLYGVCAGIGLGMMYLPAMVMVGYYFERRRALAMGIACSGSGLGIFILAPTYAYTMSCYDWKNTMLIVAGIALQGTVFGALMRAYNATPCPNPTPSDSEISDSCDTKVLLKNSPSAPAVSLTKAKCDNATEVEIACMVAADQDVEDDELHSQPDRSFTGDQSVQLYRKAMQNLLRQRVYSETSQQEENLCKSDSINAIHLNPTENPINHQRSKLPAMTQSLYELPQQNSKQMKSRMHPCPRTPSRKHMAAVSCYELPREECPQKTHLHQEEKRLIREALLQPLNRMDIFYQGSITTLPEYQSQPNLASYITSITNIPALDPAPDKATCSCLGRTKLGMLVDLLDVSILASPPFLIIALASIFIQIAYFIPIMFIMDYASTVGIEAQQAATLVSAIGISNAFGRAICGGLANLQFVRPLHLNNICLILAGAVTILMVFTCQNYAWLLVYAISYGFFVAAFVPLTTLFLVEHLGLARLTNAFGLISMVRGFSTMAGPPFAGLLLDRTSSYQWTFTFAGCMLILSAFAYYMLPLVKRCRTIDATPSHDDITDDQAPVDHLEKTPIGEDCTTFA